MISSKTGLLAVALAALLAGGCSSTRVSSLNTQAEPLEPAPAGRVTASALPPPATPAPAVADPAAFPTAPASTTVASAEPPAGAPDVTAGSVAGAWKASVSGQNCQMITSLTKFGANNRAASRQCPTPVDGVKSWNVSGKQLALYDESGMVLARLYSSSPTQFDGQTSTGLPISLSR